MRFIAHRRNTIEELIKTPHEYGVEVDIRSEQGKLIIHHDPFASGDDFEEWLKHYQHGTLILNVKEEGLEARLIELMNRLIQRFPLRVRLIGFGSIALRVFHYQVRMLSIFKMLALNFVLFRLSYRAAQQNLKFLC